MSIDRGRRIAENIRRAGRLSLPLISAILTDDENTIQAIEQWRIEVARRMFTLELKVEFDENDGRYEPMLEVVKAHGRELLAAAMLIAGGDKPPQLVAFTEDMFLDTKDIDFMEESPVTSEVTAPEAPEAPQAPAADDDGLDI